jgi:hypothetical protein
MLQVIYIQKEKLNGISLCISKCQFSYQMRFQQEKVPSETSNIQMSYSIS